ncbi:N-acetylglucosamine-1-phosphate transferase subunits alpha and beta [Lycorma delicatula]|uniref:N-acetylglucosamine-1-phosphate transferase subunits alpha and beta n=1 Tax=Lycorma delicatula TaxID=130591 RepID=UPI003F514B04
MNICKLLQKQTYNILSHKYYLLCLIFLLFTTLLSFVHLCEVWLNGMMTKDERLLLSYIVDNIGGISLERRLCQYLPIDVVYTWVNGSDPLLQSQIQQYRINLKKELTKSCTFKECLPSHFTVVRLNKQHNDKSLKNNTDNNKCSIIKTNSPVSTKKQSLIKQQLWKLCQWETPDDASKQFGLNIKTYYDNNFNNIHQPHWTTDKTVENLYSPNDFILIKLSFRLKETKISITKDLLNDWIGYNIVKLFWYYEKANAIIIHLESSINSIFKVGNSGTKWKVIKINNGISANISEVHLVLELPSNITQSDFAPSRFDDKEELRYSLRSLEKFAPWVRKVYLVTNGQIPHWLNLENPRIKIVTHYEIFTNKTHLPTFSSPAIETHLHRIPGLSEKFLYINDDIFLGSEVWPDDFVSPQHGEKVYLSWPVPDCNNDCPWLWVGNGVCDKSCNIFACAYDGGDCNDIFDNENNKNAKIQDHYPDDWSKEFYDTLNENQLRNKRDTLSNYKELFLYDKDADNNIGNIKKLFNSNNFNSNASDISIINSSNFVIRKIVKNSLNDKYFNDNIILKDTYPIFHSKIICRWLYKSISYFNKLKYNTFNNNRVRRSALNLIQQRVQNQSILYKVTNSVTSLPFDTIKTFGNDSNNVTAKGAQINNILLKKMQRNSDVKQVNNVGGGNLLYKHNEHNHVHHDDDTFSNRKLDVYAESLLHVNRIFNKVYGFKPRKVPAHMPHLIDRSIMSRLQERFKEEYEKTSSHRIRSADDMQFAFSYFYFLMSEQVYLPIEQLFDKFDTDQTGTWSDREIRTVMTRLYPLPLHQNNIIEFEKYLKQCSSFSMSSNDFTEQQTQPPYERYLGSTLPLITKKLISDCNDVLKLMNNTFGFNKKYPFTIIKHEEFVDFQMISSNLSELLYTLDKIRKKPKKFLCINDNMDPSRVDDNELIRAVLLDFYHSLFPKPSQFELPTEYRNRFFYYDEYLSWKLHHSFITTVISFVILLFGVFTFIFIFSRELRLIFRNLLLYFKLNFITIRQLQEHYIHKL